MRKIIIAIDGFSACGKSSTAKKVAESLSYNYIDSGAMYRAVTLYFIDNYINASDPKEVDKAIRDIDISFRFNQKLGTSETYLNGSNVEVLIRQMSVTQKVSEISTISAVRQHLVNEQRKLGKKRGIVMDGRDIGTNVFPDAELKIFMSADTHIRSERRQLELLEKGQVVGLTEVKENLQKRDKIDSERKENPLRKAEDAFVIDSGYLTLNEQVEKVLQLATEKMIANNE